jgi:hypothetical protein
MTNRRILQRPASAVGLALAAGAAGAVLYLAPSAPAAVPPAPWTITDNGAFGVTTIAGFRLAAAERTRDDDGPRLRALIRAWGRPASTKAFGRIGCRVTWTRPQIQATVANFGRIPRGTNACNPNVGRLQELRTLGRSWRTAEGLRVGQTRARLRALYPHAAPAVEGDPGVLMLKPRRYPCLDCDGPEDLAESRRGAVNAVIPNARVQRFTVWVGAAGD